MTARPVCVHCGAACGSRKTKMETLRWRDGEPEPQYRGNGRVVKLGSGGKSGGGALVSQGVDVASINFQHIVVWHGEWFSPYAPFCKLRCALDYARKAFKRYGNF